jgi:hypothetical protein
MRKTRETLPLPYFFYYCFTVTMDQRINRSINRSRGCKKYPNLLSVVFSPYLIVKYYMVFLGHIVKYELVNYEYILSYGAHYV